MVAVSLHYSRGGRQVSSRRSCVLLTGQAALWLSSGLLPRFLRLAQYPGQITKKDNDAPNCGPSGCWSGPARRASPRPAGWSPSRCSTARSSRTAAFTWRGRSRWRWTAEWSTSCSRTASGSGSSTSTARARSRVRGWAWKLEADAARRSRSPRAQMAQDDVDDAGSDRPVLHRKHRFRRFEGRRSRAAVPAQAGQAPAADPDRPTLHKKTLRRRCGRCRSRLPRPIPTGRPCTNPARATILRARPAADPDRPTLKKPKENKKASPRQTRLCESMCRRHRS